MDKLHQKTCSNRLHSRCPDYCSRHIESIGKCQCTPRTQKVSGVMQSQCLSSDVLHHPRTTQPIANRVINSAFPPTLPTNHRNSTTAQQYICRQSIRQHPNRIRYQMISFIAIPVTLDHKFFGHVIVIMFGPNLCVIVEMDSI